MATAANPTKLKQEVKEFTFLWTGKNKAGKIIRGEPLGEDDDTPGSSIPSVTAIPRTGEVKPATGEGDRAPA